MAKITIYEFFQILLNSLIEYHLLNLLVLSLLPIHSLVSLSICLRNWARVSFVRHQLRSRGVRFRWCFLFLWSLGEFAAAVYGGCSRFLEFKEWICDFRFSDLSLGSRRSLRERFERLCQDPVLVVLFGSGGCFLGSLRCRGGPMSSQCCRVSSGGFHFLGGESWIELRRWRWWLGQSVLFLTCEITAVFLKGVVYVSSMFARHLSSLQICSTWSCFGTFG